MVESMIVINSSGVRAAERKCSATATFDMARTGRRSRSSLTYRLTSIQNTSNVFCYAATHVCRPKYIEKMYRG